MKYDINIDLSINILDSYVQECRDSGLDEQEMLREILQEKMADANVQTMFNPVDIRMENWTHQRNSA